MKPICKFTPGPWITSHDVMSAVNTANNKKHIALVNWNALYMTMDEHFANARLISLAPEMYEELVELSKILATHVPLLTRRVAKLNDLIGKINGEE